MIVSQVPGKSDRTVRVGKSEKKIKNQKINTDAAFKAGNAERARLNSPVNYLLSPLSLKVVAAAFLTIFTVQVSVMSLFTIQKFEAERLYELKEAGRDAIVPLIETDIVDFLTSPIDEQEARNLTSTTRVTGISIYSRVDMNLLASYGTPTVLNLLNPNDIPDNFYADSRTFYEAVYRPHVLNRPYYIIARLESDNVQEQVGNYVWEQLIMMFLMSGIVTAVLMMALGRWLLEPVLFLRSNLVRASKNPENPDIQTSPYDDKDEIGSSIAIAQSLIRQNAENIQRIKSAAEDQIHKLAYYDTLTGLPNRTLFLQTLHQQGREEGMEITRFAVITIDLDHFKDINDSMGHNVGDAILRAVGKRLRSSLPETAVVARSGEDEYAITMPLSGTLTARDIAQRVAGVIRSEPFKVFNESFQVRASIGVSTYPKDGAEPDQVLKNADIALNRAKEEGRDTIKEYSEDFDRAVQQRFQMLRDLRDALEHDQLSLNFQPQLDLKTGKVIGAEALLRWFKPDNSKDGGSFISPADFIPIAEQSGLIVPIGEMVLMKACETAIKWREAGYDIRIAVNVSGAQFYQSDLVSFTSKVLEQTGLQPSRLELEVTESVFMEDVSHAIQTLQELHALGVELAIDDFGTGYSSLSYLRQFPIDRLKIDQSFIRNALNNPDDAAIARTIVKLGHSLNLKVIAEGVETKEHELFLLNEGCDEVQGFRYSKPVKPDDFMNFLTNYDGDLNSF